MTNNELALNLMREQDEATDNAEMVATVESWIADALDEFASAYDWRIFKGVVSKTLTASNPFLELDSDIIDVRGIRFVDTNEPIDYFDEQNLYRIAEDLETTGKPFAWFFADALEKAGTSNQKVYQLRFVFIPDANYAIELNVNKFPTLVSLASASEIPLRQEMLLAIKDRVRAYILMNDKDYEGANTYLQLFYARVEKMIAKENTQPSARMLRMEVSDISNSRTRHRPLLDPAHFRN